MLSVNTVFASDSDSGRNSSSPHRQYRNPLHLYQAVLNALPPMPVSFTAFCKMDDRAYKLSVKSVPVIHKTALPEDSAVAEELLRTLNVKFSQPYLSMAIFTPRLRRSCSMGAVAEKMLAFTEFRVSARRECTFFKSVTYLRYDFGRLRFACGKIYADLQNSQSLRPVSPCRIRTNVPLPSRL